MKENNNNKEKQIDKIKEEESPLTTNSAEVRPAVSEQLLNDLVRQISITKLGSLANRDKSSVAEMKKGISDMFANIKPQDDIEAMLVAQIIATHEATMVSFSHANAARSAGEVVSKFRELSINQSVKLTRNYTILMQALAAYRNQVAVNNVKVKNVHVHDGGQAIVGNINKHEKS